MLAVALAGAFGPVAAQPGGKVSGEAIVTDVEGKETRLTGLKLTTGTRRLAWLGDPKGTTPDTRLGPLAVEVREPNSTTFAKGVVTLVPAASVESAKYDYDKLSAFLTVKGLKDPLTGTLQYKGVNVLGVGGTADGKAASFTGGLLGKAAVKSIVFPDAVPLPEAKPGGTTWAVQIVHPAAMNPTVRAKNLKLLYQFPGGVEQLVDAVPVRKGPPVPLDGKLTRFEMLATDLNTNVAAAEVESGGTERTVAFPLALEQDGRTGTLVGFLGEVEAGYKLFPLHTVKVIVPFSRKAD